MFRKPLCAAACAALVLTVIAPVRPADACSFAPNADHELDPDEQAVDATVPAAPEVVEVELIRRPEPDGCATAVSSCDGSGSIGIAVTAQDDRTAAAEMGYVLRLVDGELPEGLSLPSQPVRAFDDEFLWLQFIDRDQPVSFTLEVSAVDRAGNQGPPVEVVVADDIGGCSAGGSAGSLLWLFGLFLVIGLRWQRRSRAIRD